MAASRSPIYRRVAAPALAAVLCLEFLLPPAGTAARAPRVDFFDERLEIPDSRLFKEADYIESGVGLRFGVDKRLSYFSGQYAEASQRFAEALKQYRYKAEIWVYLARAQFYHKDPRLARQTLERAAAIMPDLRERFWDPLIDSLLGEIRRRARELQTQIDYYSKSQGDFLTLFRLYLFLDDAAGAGGVVGRAEEQASRMELLATMVSGESRQRYRQEAEKWAGLARQLRGEMQGAGLEAPAARPVAGEVGEDADLIEQTRFLQVKVDFYSSQPEDFRQLFENYLLLDMPEGARGVVAALEREEKRLQSQADVAADIAQESEYLAAAEVLAALRAELSGRLPAPAAPAP